MKINGEKIKEVERLQNELARKYDERSLGVRVARSSLPDRGIKGFIMESTERKLRKIEIDIYLAGQRFRDFAISTSEGGYEITYDKLPIGSANEFERCKRDFMNKINKFVESIENKQILYADEEKDFMTVVNEFLSKLEEATKEE